MNDNSNAGKIANTDKNDKQTLGKKTNVGTESARPNLSDSATSLQEKTSALETKVKASERRISTNSKTMTRTSNNPRLGRDRPRREDNRRLSSSGRPGRRSDGSYTRGGSGTGQGAEGSFSASPSPQPSSRENGGFDKKLQDTGGGRSYHGDENKIYKLMRRLFMISESRNEREKRFQVAKSLREYLLTAEGTKICAMNSIDILNHLQQVFFERGNKDLKQEIAACIGYIGSTLGQEVAGYFDWLFAQANNPAVDDNVKTYFLQALLETLRQDEKKQHIGGIMTKVMSSIQSLLENADSDLLVAVLDVILFVSRFYPHIFSSHFRNTVDILVGWHIDLTQKESLIQYVSNILISFHQFWSSDISFSTTLLIQFLEDLEAYAEDLMTSAAVDQPTANRSEERLPPPFEFAVKMGALLRVFTTVIESLGDNLSPTKNKISVEFSCKLLVKVVASIETAMKYVNVESLVIAANNCISILVAQLGTEAFSCSDNLLNFVTLQAFGSRLSSRTFLLSLFSLMQRVVAAFGTLLPVAFLTKLFEPESLLLTARLSHFQEVQQQLMAVYHVVLGLKSVPLLEESYKLVLADLEAGLRTLLPADRQGFTLVPDGTSCARYSQRQAEAIIIFNLNALAEIANTKNNLIGMWALSPSIFDLLSERLDPADPWMAECHPCLQYAILHTLYGHCCRHGNFISSSELLAQSDSTAGMTAMSQTTSGYLTRILDILAKVLHETRTSFDSRCLVLKWVQEVVTGLNSTPRVLVTPPFLALVKSVIAQGFDREAQISLAAAQCLSFMFKSGAQFAAETIRRCLELCAFRLTDHRKLVKEMYFSLLRMLHLDIIASSAMAFEGEEEALARQRKDRTVGLKMSWLARRNHLGFVSLGLFHTHNFRHIISYMLNNTLPSHFGSLHWLEAMFYNCQRSQKEVERGQDNILLSDLDATESVLWFWATYETAQFTVLSRLRTPLGKPQDTFMTIESVLKTFAAEARTAMEIEEQGVNTDFVKHEKAGEYGCLQRVHVLLQYMEHLERLLYNAYEGCAVALAPPPKIVKTFFRTNRNTCLEWLSRIRMCIMTVAAHAGLPAVVVRHAHELLSDLLDLDTTQGTEFEQGVVLLVRALCDLQCPEAVLGVYSWCRQVAGKKFAWVKAVAEKASKRYEQAAREYQSILKSLLSMEDGTDSKESSDADVSPEHRLLARKDSMDLVGPSRPKSAAAKNLQPTPAVVSFLISEVLECYLKLSDWQSVMEWQEQLTIWRAETSLSALQTSFNSSVDINLIKAMQYFDFGDMEAVRTNLELVPGASLTEGNKAEHSNMHNWNPATDLGHMRRQFLRAATLLEEQRQTNHRAEVIRFLNQAEKTGEGLLRLCAMEWPPALPSEVLTEMTIAGTLRRQLEDRKGKTYLLPLSNRLCVWEDQEVANFLQMLRLVSLQLHMNGADKTTELTTQVSNLQIAAATLARKQGNFELAENMLLRQIALLSKACNSDTDATIVDHEHDELLPALTSLLKKRDSLDMIELMRVERETAKLLFALNQPKGALDVISNSIACCLTCSDTQGENGLIKHGQQASGELCSRSLMTLTKWLQSDSRLMASLSADTDSICLTGYTLGQGDMVTSNLSLLLDCEAHGMSRHHDRFIENLADFCLEGFDSVSESEKVVGKLLHLSTMESPGLAKAWFMFAGWCYKWGRKTVDSASHGSADLTPEEKNAINSILPHGTSQKETERIMGILSQVHDLNPTTEEDISDQDQSLYDDGTERTRKQLLAGGDLLFMAGNEHCMEMLLEVWQGVVRRVYHLYQLSASAYFIFLQLSDHLSKDEDNEDGNIIATLRLLRLLVKHAWELQSVLENGLAHTPTAPWKGIIPQLFARLSHPENYVRHSVSELLCRVAQDAPHLIVYPAIVGSTSGRVESKCSEESKFLNNYLREEEKDDDTEVDPIEGGDDDDDDDSNDDSSSTMLQTCLASIVDTLSQHNPRMISEVQGMVMELRRVTLLWEELWLGTLSQHHADIQRRLAQLEAEIRKVNTNPNLSRQDKLTIIREKHRTILKPTMYTMERLYEITSQPPETPHEAWFQQTYGDLIRNALERLKNPSNPAHPHASWQLFKQVYISLQQRAAKRGSLQLKMEEISPKLAALSNSLIPMPGIGLPGQMVTVEKVCNTVQILPTKTKPKKMVFIGSDGKRHPYLFKGLEDLHLDERIMQFLSIVNNMFVSSCKGRGRRMEYHARHYSVTPLGPRSGLIQWVEGATPLFGLYKKWQQREALAQILKSGVTPNPNTAAPPIQRPSEVFFSKLTPALKEKGLEATENRKEWPVSILRKVLEDLMDDTPNDLLAKEIWCASAGAGEWWQMMQTYSRSTAVMSMIGYIIGLGDRHLDNVLIDLATGEVVHIDYNVCFEKGKNLRVPERVPFRMTQNIEAAFGVTGVEGIFRLSCEHVLRTMRRGRETLLTLLEAFVYDPLVDWTTGNEGGYTGAFYGGEMGISNTGKETSRSKHEMEREITLSMFAIRCAEMSASWARNKENILAAVPELQACLELWLSAVGHLDTGQQTLDSLNAVHLTVLEATANPSHPLYSLSDRYSDYAVLKATKEEALHCVDEKKAEFSRWHQLHKATIESMQGLTFQKLFTELSKHQDLGQSSFSTATDFLQSAGQTKNIVQCEQLEAEMQGLVKQQQTLIGSALEILGGYSLVVSQFGVAFANQNRAYTFLRYLQELADNFTAAKCEEITSQFQDQYGPQVSQSTHGQLILHIHQRLEGILSDSNSKLIKLLERSGLDDGLAPIEVHEMSLQDAQVAIHKFLQECGAAGERSLIGFVVSALSSLSKRYLLMESASSAAGERLMDLTSRDGDWFLEELSSISGNVNHFLDTLDRNTALSSSDNFRELHSALCATSSLYVAIQDLNMNFRSIILPETLKLIQSQEPSILSLLSQLECLVRESTQPLELLMEQLELCHRNYIVGIEMDSSYILNSVRQMHHSFNSILQSIHYSSDLEQTDLTPGQMLLMGFDGLFSRVDAEFTQLLTSVSSVEIPEAWGKVDAVRDARTLQLSPWSSETRSMLSSLFFLKRIQAMQEFFHMATQLAAALQGLNGGAVFDDEQMARPIKKFIAEFVRKQLIGFPSQLLGCMVCVLVEWLGLNVTSEVALRDVGALVKVPLEDLCKKAVEANLRIGHFQHHHLAQATSLTSAQDLEWRKLDLARRMEISISLHKSACQRWQGLLSRYHWLHEDHLLPSSIKSTSNIPLVPRVTLMSEIKRTMSALAAQESLIGNCRERYTALEGLVIQRLRWAAGANPSLNSILQNFQDASAARARLIEEESNVANEVMNICQGVLHFEAWRTRTQDAVNTENAFLALINRCYESCVLIEATLTSVTDQELQLLNIKPLQPEMRVDTAWLEAVGEQIAVSLAETEKAIHAMHVDIAACTNKIMEKVAQLRSLLSIHHKLMSDIRSILKTMAKLEEQDYGEEITIGGIREYLASYRLFSENITTTLKAVVSEDATRDTMASAQAVLTSLMQLIPSIYDRLMQFVPSLLQQDTEETPVLPDITKVMKREEESNSTLRKLASLKDQVPLAMGSPHRERVSAKKDRVSRDPRTGKAIQERNSYAVGVWRRVKMKLDGRDPDSSKRLSVPEQVDYVIKEARDLDNLCLLYEGWTPWV